jgi:hypothetical protein
MNLLRLRDMEGRESIAVCEDSLTEESILPLMLGIN